MCVLCTVLCVCVCSKESYVASVSSVAMCHSTLCMDLLRITLKNIHICNIYIYISIEFVVALNHTYVHREFDRQPVKCRITDKHGYNVLLVCGVWHRVH